MASSITVVSEKNPFMDGSVGGNFKIIVDWLSDASAGTVSNNIAATFSAAQLLLNPVCPQPSKILGVLRSIETIPGLHGDLTTTEPTSAYTITLLDSYGYDISGGTLTNRSTSVAQKEVPSSKIIIDSEITFTIASSCGNSKTGRCIIEFEDLGGHKF